MHSFAMAFAKSYPHSPAQRRVSVACVLIAFGLAMPLYAAPPAERHLAPGVLTTIPPDFNPDDTVSTHDVMEIRSNSEVDWKPEYIASSDTLYGMSDKTKFR